MKKYQYQLLRYVHDQFTSEFLNIGVIVYSPEDYFLKTIVSPHYKRINDFFPKANGKFIRKTAKQFENAIQEYSKKLIELFPLSDDLSAITKAILPTDNSAFVLTDVRSAIDIDMEAALTYLYHNIVEKYNVENANVHTITDNDVWKNKYKEYFDLYDITNKLTIHEVKSKNDSFSFDKSWKNEIWHCFQPISFHMHDIDYVKEKVYKWSGKLNELNTIEDKIHLTFLTTIPDQYDDLHNFIIQKLDQDSEILEVDVILEKDAEKLAKKVSIMMKEHDTNS